MQRTVKGRKDKKINKRQERKGKERREGNGSVGNEMKNTKTCK